MFNTIVILYISFHAGASVPVEVARFDTMEQCIESVDYASKNQKSWSPNWDWNDGFIVFHCVPYPTR